MEAVSDTQCLYLYGVVAATMPVTRFCESSDSILIPYKNIACAAASVPASEYSNGLPSGDTDQINWLAPRAWRHHAILLELMGVSPVVPFRFGMTCASVADVLNILANNYESFWQSLSAVSGKEEWAIEICVDTPSSVDHVRQAKPELQQANAIGSGQSAGLSYLLQKKNEKLARAYLDQQLSIMQADCCNRLEDDTSALRHTRPATRDTEKICVANLAVLVAKDQFTTLKQVLTQIESDYAQYLATVHMTGPWPPYSFVSSGGSRL